MNMTRATNSYTPKEWSQDKDTQLRQKQTLKKPHPVECDLKKIPPSPTRTTKTCFFNEGDHSFPSTLEMRALKDACSNNKLRTEQLRQV